MRNLDSLWQTGTGWPFPATLSSGTASGPAGASQIVLTGDIRNPDGQAPGPGAARLVLKALMRQGLSHRFHLAADRGMPRRQCQNIALRMAATEALGDAAYAKNRLCGFSKMSRPEIGKAPCQRKADCPRETGEAPRAVRIVAVRPVPGGGEMNLVAVRQTGDGACTKALVDLVGQRFVGLLNKQTRPCGPGASTASAASSAATQSPR
jgi:hypothetical protein